MPFYAQQIRRWEVFPGPTVGWFEKVFNRLNTENARLQSEKLKSLEKKPNKSVRMKTDS
jgi:hypothetical protein